MSLIAQLVNSPTGQAASKVVVVGCCPDRAETTGVWAHVCAGAWYTCRGHCTDHSAHMPARARRTARHTNTIVSRSQPGSTRQPTLTLRRRQASQARFGILVGPLKSSRRDSCHHRVVETWGSKSVGWKISRGYSVRGIGDDS
jgi:hypothetical protein